MFVNCPFDRDYLPTFRAIIFTIVRCGFRPRCALEVNDGGDVRIEKIARIIRDCPVGVHDICRTELDDANALPRFNMPLELGLFLGARYFGKTKVRRKACLILDREPYRYQKFISDIAGQDIASHGGDPYDAIREVRNFLNDHNGRHPLPDRDSVLRPEFETFQRDLPAICRRLGLNPDDLQYPDYVYIVSDYVSDDRPSPQP